MEGNYEREQIEYLMNIPLCEEGREYLKGMGYFDAPASGHHHLAERGGLVKHSIHVTRWLLKLTESMGVYSLLGVFGDTSVWRWSIRRHGEGVGSTPTMRPIIQTC